MSSARFLEASFVISHCDRRTLIVPLSPNVASPDNRTWQEVTDSVLEAVPSKMLFALVGTQLQRDLKSLAIRHLDRWVFDRGLESDIKKLMLEAKSRYLAIRNGVFAKELYRAILQLFRKDPRFVALLSNHQKATSAAFAVTRRVLGQIVFTWEIAPFDFEGNEGFSARLFQEMREIVYECLSRYPLDREMMPSHRFIRYEFYLKKMGQFLGIDRDYDKLFCLFADTCRLFPRDGSSLYGVRLDEFWRRMTKIGEEITKRMEVAPGVIATNLLGDPIDSEAQEKQEASGGEESTSFEAVSFKGETLDLPLFA